MIQYLVIIGAFAQLIGIGHYVRETISGRTKPNKVTWLMWTIAPLIATAAAISDGVTWAILPVFMAGFGPLMVFSSSFINPKSYWKMEKFDYVCGLLSVLALILWWVTKDPKIAIAFSIASDGFAAIPTLFKAWKHPETETISPFATTIFASILGLFAIRSFSFSEYSFPLYLIILNIVFVIFILRGKEK